MDILRRAVANSRASGSGLIVTICSPTSEAFPNAAGELGLSYINTSEEVALRLLDRPIRERHRYVEEAIADVLAPHPREVALGRLGLLFQPDLAIDPVKVLVTCARYRLVLAEWGGTVTGTTLRYAKPGHSEYRRWPDCTFPITHLTEEMVRKG